MNEKKYLPIGSIVLLKGGEKRVMIYGRKQLQTGTDRVWDYIACLYPEGNIGGDMAYLFDHEQIEQVYFLGFQDSEEFAYRKQFLEGESL